MSEITSLQTVIKDLQTQVAALTADLAMQIAALKDASKALTERQAKVAALEAELQYHREHSGCVETQCQIGLFLDCNIPVAPAQVAPLKQEEKTDG